MSNTYSIRGVLTLTSPAHQSSPEKGGPDDSKNHTQLLATRVMTDEGSLVVPIITANSARGVMRRLAASRVMEALKRNKQQIGRDLYLSVVRGSYSRTGLKRGGATIAEHNAARNDLFAGLFGGGALMLPARLRMENDLMPMVAETRELFPTRWRESCRGQLRVRDDDGRFRSALVDKILITGRDDVAAGRGSDVIADYEAAYREHVLGVAEKSAAKKNQKAAAKAAKASGASAAIPKEDVAKSDSLATFVTADVIVPGVRLYFGASLANVTEAQLGLALLAVQDWVNFNALGGGSARGRGSFAASLTLEHNGTLVTDTLLENEVPGSSLCAHPLVASAIAAAERELEAITPKSLGIAYPTNTEPEASDAELAGADA